MKINRVEAELLLSDRQTMTWLIDFFIDSFENAPKIATIAFPK